MIGGPDRAAVVLASYLRTELPGHLAALRALYPSVVIPDPRTVSSADLGEIGAEHWPAILVAPDELLENVRTGQTADARPLFEAAYRMSAEGYLRGKGYEATGALTRIYAAAVRSALTSKPTLRHVGIDWTGAFPRVDAGSIREEYAPVFEPSRGRTVGSFRTTFTLRQQEAPLLPVTHGMIESVDVEHTLVGPNEPLPTPGG